MSRTFRRKNTNQNGMWSDLKYFTSEWVYPWKDADSWVCQCVSFPKDSAEYRKGVARFHSDGGTTSFKEPGPSWFRRIFKRKYNAKVRNEISTFLKDPEYEVDLHDSTEKYHMDYWT